MNRERRIRELMEIAGERLRERGIELNFDPAAIDAILNHELCRTEFNPRHANNKRWHECVGNPIEELLLQDCGNEIAQIQIDPNLNINVAKRRPAI